MTTRIVLDTNILISAVLTPQGAPAQVLLMCLQQLDIQLCVSGATFAEYEEVIGRPRFQRTNNEIEATLSAIRERALWVKPTEVIHTCSDPADDIFLECARAASAHFLVTGNAKHFPPSWEGTRILTPREFLDTVF